MSGNLERRKTLAVAASVEIWDLARKGQDRSGSRWIKWANGGF